VNQLTLGMLAVVMSSGFGCASPTYAPAKGPRISITSDGLVRDGVKHRVGWGGGVVKAVRGNPRAEREASAARDLITGGHVCTFAGIALEIGGLSMMLTGTKEDEMTGKRTATTTGKVGSGIFLGGLGVWVLGTVLLNNGNARALDAINIYNDRVDGLDDTTAAPDRLPEP
jgi:hypothetical protein